MTDTRRAVAGGISEDSLIRNVIDLAHALGYLACHFRPARTDKGWRTPVQGDKGFPDLLIAGHGRFIVAEGKAETGKLSDDQKLWIPALQAAGVDVRIWRPSTWLSGEIQEALV